MSSPRARRSIIVLALLAIPACGHPFEPDGDHPFWDRDFIVLAHKGGLGAFPENTIPAFEYGLSQGADGVEMDVQLCATGEVVVFHDYIVDNLTDGTGKVAELTLAQIQSFLYDYDTFDTVPPIPTLQEVIVALPATTLLDIEMKGESAGTDGLEAAVVRIIEEHGIQDRTILTSFNAYQVKRVENDRRYLLTGLITGPELPWYAESERFIEWSRADAVVPFTGWTDSGYLRRRPDHHMIAWFVDGDVPDPQVEYERLIALGVKGLVTDHPALVVGLLPASRR